MPRFAVSAVCAVAHSQDVRIVGKGSQVGIIEGVGGIPIVRE